MPSKSMCKSSVSETTLVDELDYKWCLANICLFPSALDDQTLSEKSSYSSIAKLFHLFNVWVVILLAPYTSRVTHVPSRNFLFSSDNAKSVLCRSYALKFLYKSKLAAMVHVLENKVWSRDP